VRHWKEIPQLRASRSNMQVEGGEDGGGRKPRVVVVLKSEEECLAPTSEPGYCNSLKSRDSTADVIDVLAILGPNSSSHLLETIQSECIYAC